MSTDTYIDPVFTTELREWVQNDTEPYIPNEVAGSAWNKGLPKEMQPHYGKTLTEEHKKKCSEAKMGEKNGFYGKKHSPETQKKMREAQANRTSESYEGNREKMRGVKNPFYGKTHSPEALKKMSAVHKGKTISEETKKKMSESIKKMWAKKQLPNLS